MDISLVKALLLLAGLLANGRPDGWNVAWQASLSVGLPGPVGALEFRLDPVPYFYRPLGGLCGAAYGAYYVIDPAWQEKGCVNTPGHEAAHIGQARAWGLVQPLTYAIAPGLWEPTPQYLGPEAMYVPRGLNWPLLRFWVPLHR